MIWPDMAVSGVCTSWMIPASASITAGRTPRDVIRKFCPASASSGAVGAVYLPCRQASTASTAAISRITNATRTLIPMPRTASPVSGSMIRMP